MSHSDLKVRRHSQRWRGTQLAKSHYKLPRRPHKRARRWGRVWGGGSCWQHGTRGVSSVHSALLLITPLSPQGQERFVFFFIAMIGHQHFFLHHNSFAKDGDLTATAPQKPSNQFCSVFRIAEVDGGAGFGQRRVGEGGWGVSQYLSLLWQLCDGSLVFEGVDEWKDSFFHADGDATRHRLARGRWAAGLLGRRSGHQTLLIAQLRERRRDRVKNSSCVGRRGTVLQHVNCSDASSLNSRWTDYSCVSQ